MLEGKFSFGSTSASALAPPWDASTGSTSEVVLIDLIMKALAQDIRNAIPSQMRALL